MSVIKILEDTFFDWLSEFGTVVFANQSLGIQDYPFIVCNLKSFDKIGTDQEIYNLKNDEVVRYGMRSFSISIDIYDSENGNAQEIAQNIINSIDSRKTYKIFRNINLVLDNNVKAINLTTFIKSTFEQRIHIDIQAKYTTNIQEKIETIDLKNVEIKGILNAIS